MAVEPKIVLLDKGSFTVDLDIRPIAAPHQWVCYEETAEAQMVAHLAGAYGAIANAPAFPAAVLSQLLDLRILSVCSAGVDHIDLDYCAAHGIAVRNVPGYAARTVAEHVFCLVLALRRNLLAYHRDVVAGYWQASGQNSPARHAMADLHGQRLGTVGSGAIGQAVADIGRGFGMTPVFARRRGGAAAARSPGEAETAPFDEVLEGSDILTLHCPLTAETRDMIAAPELRRMKPEALLINTARGGVVNEDALVDAVTRGVIGGAGFDVAAHEPLSDESPLVKLIGHDRFILTPHVGWASRQAQQNLLDKAIANVEDFLRASNG